MHTGMGSNPVQLIGLNLLTLKYSDNIIGLVIVLEDIILYRAIIVDDELKICQLIQCLGAWESLNIEIIDICQDGEAALESIVKYQPDIVLTDIRMPVYDGLEIIQQVRKQDMDTAFIVISGYKQFEYARQALQYGVVDFLVKPINQEDLNSALQKAVNGIIEQKNVQNVNEILHNKEKSEKVALLNRLASGIETEDLTDSGQLHVESSLFKKDIFQAVIIKTNKMELNMRKSKFSEDMLSNLERIISIEDSIEVAKDDGVYLLLNYEKSEYKCIKEELFEIVKRMVRDRDIYGQFEMTMGVGLPVTSIGDMKRSIETARIAWQQRLLLSDREYLEYDKLHIATESKTEFWSDKEWKEFQAALESCNQSKASELLSLMETHVNQEDRLNLDCLFDYIRRIVLQIEQLVTEGETLTTNPTYIHIMEELKCSDSVSDVFLHLKLYMNKSLQEYYDRKTAMKKLPIIKAEEYIAEHYMQDISLEEMAQQVDLSPAYFSKLFKMVEGVNYIEYLTQVRIEQSKKLLRTTTLPVKTIATTVGYMDEKYFRKLFKKIVGIKPSDYRKLH